MMQAIQSAPITIQLLRFDRRWRDQPEDVRAAVLDLIAEPYVRLGYPTDEAFASAFNVPIGSLAYREAWAAEVARRKHSHRAAYGDDDWVYALCARGSAGELVALATILTVHGTRDVALGEAIGDPASSFPTLRMLTFACDSGPGSLSADVPECRLAELARMAVRQSPDLAALVSGGSITLAAAAYVEAHGFNEMFAMSYWRDQARPEPPVAYLGNSPPWMIDALERRGLDVRRLYRMAGAGPTPRVLQSGESTSAYFKRWEALVAPLVPQAVLAQGIAAAVRYLAQQEDTGWHSLALSLPFYILNSPKTRAAMASLALACGLIPEAHSAGTSPYRDH
jgi:hypothetical protein